MRKFNVVFGEVIQESYSNIPQLPVIITDEAGDEVMTTYLTPFRRYCFQISGDTFGNCDMGASPVMNFSIMYYLTPEMRKDLMKGQIALAIEYFLSHGYAIRACERYLETSQDKEFIIIRPDCNPNAFMFGSKDESIANYDDFINKCDEWLFD